VKKVVAQYANDKAGDTVEEQIEGWRPGSFLETVGQLQQGKGSVGDLLYDF
jgi:hypothetical protein